MNMVKITGKVHIELRDDNGNVKETRDVSNLVVALGCAYIADQLSDKGETVMSHMAIGNDNTEPTCSDTTLANELARVALTSTTQDTGANDNKVIYIATFDAGVGTGSIKEAGIFNASSNGTMLCRTTFDTITKGASDALIITWTITIGSC